MTNRRRMAEQWDSFARAVLPVGTSPLQRQEMRRAFYAGAEGIMDAMAKAMGPSDTVTPEELETVAELHLELREFAKLVKAGRA